MRPADSGESCCWQGGYAIGQCVAVVQDQDQDQVAQAKTKLLKPKLWKAEITDHELTTNSACNALLQNARVNATPVEPEDAAVKRKRQQRRASKKHNLIKELNALSVCGTEPAARPTISVMQVQPILPVPPTMEQEGKQEDDDPADHQRRFASAYAGCQLQVTSEVEPQHTTDSFSAERTTAKRARNAERQHIRRAQMTASQTERAKEKDRVRRKAARARIAEERRGGIRGNDCLRQRQMRAQQEPEERAGELDRNRLQQRARREVLGEEEHKEEQARNTQSHRTKRQEQPPVQRATEREQNRVSRKAPQRCHGHVNHEAFSASMVTCKGVVDGRHRLPPTTVCPSCQAWKWPAESDFICCLKCRMQLPPLQSAPPRLLQLYGDKEFHRHIRAYNKAFAFTSIEASSSDNTFRDVNQDQSVAGQHGVYTYRIQGAMGHFMGSMLPYVDRRTGERVPPKFAEIYIVDPDMRERANRQKGIFADLDIVALQDIENMMVECNPVPQQFLSFGQKLREDLARGMLVKDIRYVLHSKSSEPRTYNLPTVSEVGVAMVEDGNLTRPRDLYVVAKDHSLLRLFETDEKYDPLQYPLLFPYGDLGWTYTDVYANGIYMYIYHGCRVVYRVLRVYFGYRVYRDYRVYRVYCVYCVVLVGRAYRVHRVYRAYRVCLSIVSIVSINSIVSIESIGCHAYRVYRVSCLSSFVYIVSSVYRAYRVYRVDRAYQCVSCLGSFQAAVFAVSIKSIVSIASTEFIVSIMSIFSSWLSCPPCALQFVSINAVAVGSNYLRAHTRVTRVVTTNVTTVVSIFIPSPSCLSI
ncbi:unnamed protein product [Phytophthora fragariaefolia]|uniref:Unnamed protein product n=1 Tax=Phytophthora fragariaefolia TaxID=1490495 RepID=A0A9W6Y5F4_9STRA|nr:unnamed protein product [Phytophthora fragariaefolia]